MKKLFRRKKKEPDLKTLKKLYIRIQIEFIIFFGIFAAFVYFNYDYLVFKGLIAGNYIYIDTLDEIYKEQLNVDTDGNYYKNFDDIAISLFVDKIQEKNNDVFTEIYLKGEYDDIKSLMDAEAKGTYVEKIDENTVYCKLTNFSPTSLKIFKENSDNLQGYKYLILDMQDNSGGTLNSAKKIADYFLDKGMVIYTEKMKSETLTSTYKAKTERMLNYEHIYILQNEYTASAAEVLENALIENLDNVTTVGTVTYGKGIGQAELRLTNGYGIKATVMRLLTPDGNSIHLKGITPDIEYKGENIKDFVLGIIKGAN